MTGHRHAVLSDVAARIASLRRSHPVRVAIDGVDAAGKTTLADALAPYLQRLGRPVVRASLDGFHNPRAVRWRRGRESPQGYFYDSFNYAALIESLLRPFGPGGSCLYRSSVFDFRTELPTATEVKLAPPDSVLLLDGVFLLREELREYFDYAVFVHADFDVTVARAEHRDSGLLGGVDEVRRLYRERYVPGQRIYLTVSQPERWASIVLNNNDPARPRIEDPALP